MKTLAELNQELEDLKVALQRKTISVNEYSSMYYQTYQKIKILKTSL